MRSERHIPPGRGLRRLLPGLLLLAVVLFGCGEDTDDEDVQPPPPPALRIKFCDGSGLEFPEQGIDAEAGGQGIRIEWEQPERPADLAGFEIWRSLDLDSGFVRLDLDPERFLEGNPQWFGWLDTAPELRPEFWWGPRAWYRITALDRAGNRSQPSDTTSYRLWASPRLIPDWVQLEEDLLQVQWQFQWADLFVYGFRGFRLIIAAQGTELPFWTREILLGLEPTMSESIDLAAIGLPAGNWRLRVDTMVAPVEELDPLGPASPSNPDGCALSGSESNWISFTY
jgi:hypothetical protein